MSRSETTGWSRWGQPSCRLSRRFGESSRANSARARPGLPVHAPNHRAIPGRPPHARTRKTATVYRRNQGPPAVKHELVISAPSGPLNRRISAQIPAVFQRIRSGKFFCARRSRSTNRCSLFRLSGSVCSNRRAWRRATSWSKVLSMPASGSEASSTIPSLPGAASPA